MSTMTEKDVGNAEIYIRWDAIYFLPLQHIYPWISAHLFNKLQITRPVFEQFTHVV